MSWLFPILLMVNSFPWLQNGRMLKKHGLFVILLNTYGMAWNLSVYLFVSFYYNLLCVLGVGGLSVKLYNSYM